MDLMRLYMRIARIARTRQPKWKVVVFVIVAALCFGVAALQWLGYAPDWMTAHRVKVPRLHL